MQTVNAEVVLKATNVDGVYDADPRHNPNARLIETELSWSDIKRSLSNGHDCITLCQENNIPGKDATSFDTLCGHLIPVLNF